MDLKLAKKVSNLTAELSRFEINIKTIKNLGTVECLNIEGSKKGASLYRSNECNEITELILDYYNSKLEAATNELNNL